MQVTIKGKLYGCDAAPAGKDGTARFRGYITQGEPGDGRPPDNVSFLGGPELAALVTHVGAHVALEARVYVSEYKGKAYLNVYAERFAVWGKDEATIGGSSSTSARAAGSAKAS